MDDFVLWTWVVGGAPLTLALIKRSFEWSRGAVGAWMKAPHAAAGDPSASDSWTRWAHA